MAPLVRADDDDVDGLTGPKHEKGDGALYSFN